MINVTMDEEGGGPNNGERRFKEENKTDKPESKQEDAFERILKRELAETRKKISMYKIALVEMTRVCAENNKRLQRAQHNADHIEILLNKFKELP